MELLVQLLIGVPVALGRGVDTDNPRWWCDTGGGTFCGVRPLRFKEVYNES
jgi:hypothetical protein